MNERGECLICGEYREAARVQPSVFKADGFPVCADCNALPSDKQARRLRKTMYHRSGMGSFAAFRI